MLTKIGQFILLVLLIMVCIYVIRWVAIRYDIPVLRPLAEGV